MIKIQKLYKHYGSRTVLNEINLEFPDRGVIALVGESGSGKTTLLNSIGGIDLTYNGLITINGSNLQSMDENKLADFRLRNIGYVFQNLNLINLETVFTNVKMPLDSSSNAKEHIKKKRVNEALQLVAMKTMAKKQVNKLSGGEKQRVAIAKAMINAPKVLLCDEPTGALDSKTAEQVYSILKAISRNSLVIIATHDLVGASTIADQIIKIEDGKITAIENQSKKDLGKYPPPIIGGGKKTKKSALPISFQLNHALHKINSKKIRFLITNFMISLSLTGVGISLILTSSVEKKMEDAFRSILNGNQIVMELRQNNANLIDGVYTASEDRLLNLYDRYANYVDGIGATYQVNFEDFFKDKNEVFVNSTNYKYDLSSYSVRTFNDYKWIDEVDRNVILPKLDNDLADDELIIGMTYPDMVNLCFELKILRNFNSLAEYIFDHFLTICLHVQNDDWQYEDEQTFRIMGVFETNTPCFVHTNKMWNKVVFEDYMRFPSNDGSKVIFPWEMYRFLYFHTIEDPKKFLDAVYYDEDAYDFVFERTNYDYHPLLCKIGEVCTEKRVIAYYVDKKTIRPNALKSILKMDSRINDYYFISDAGYVSYGSNFLSGFAKNLFVSLYHEKIDAAIDADTMKKENDVEISLPKGVIQGNFLNSLSGGLRFSSHITNLIGGRKPENNNEIVISSGLAQELDNGFGVLNSKLIIAGDVTKVVSLDDTKKEYRKVEAKIVGIVNEEKSYLYHNNNWTISFFRDNLGVSSFNLLPKSIVFEFDNEVDTISICEKFNKTFYDYVFSNPLENLSNSISETLSYAKTILLLFSVLSSIISILLLVTVLLLSILESKQDITVYKCTGIRNSDIKSSFVSEAIVQTLIAFFFTMIEMITVDIAISFVLDDAIGSTSTFSINPLPILIVFIIAIFSSFTISQFVVSILLKKKKKQAVS